MTSDLRQFIETRGDPRQVLIRWELLLEVAAEVTAYRGTDRFERALEQRRRIVDMPVQEPGHPMTDADEADCALFFRWACDCFEDPDVVALLEPYMSAEELAEFWRAAG